MRFYKKRSLLAVSVLCIVLSVLPLCSCGDGTYPALEANWAFDHAKTGSGTSKASDYDIKEIPRFICDNDLNVTLYMRGAVHYGKATAQKINSYIIDFNDSEKNMTATTNSAYLTLAVEGKEDMNIVFKLSDTRPMIPATEKEGALSIEAKLTSQDPFTVEFTNNSDELWSFGEYYKLEIYKDGIWYWYPSKEPVAVHDLGHELKPGQTQGLTYDLTPFGKLEPGEYRVACGDLGDSSNFYYAGFRVDSNGKLSFGK